MPKAAIFFFIILLSSMTTYSYAFTSGDLISVDNIQDLVFDSEILDIDLDFFSENNFKRYLIFGTNPQKNDFLQTNSIYQIQSDNGFFYISVLSEKSDSNLISQGYHVVEDFKLDFHSSNDDILDASRIGDITGSSISKKI